MKGIWIYQHLLPPIAEEARLTLGEGNTPLVRSRYIGKALGLENLFFKLENLNPSGSYKDRFAAMAVSKLVEQGVHVCLATSSGNTGAALAAYCAVADIPCIMAIVDGAPDGKLQQMQVYGASTLMIRDFGKSPAVTTEVMAGLQELAKKYGTGVQISAYCYCPEAMQGVQTIAYEIAEVLHRPAQVFVPAGGGGLTFAIARGFAKWETYKSISDRNIVHCVQPIGNDTIVSALAEGRDTAQSASESKTAISGLQVPNVLDGDEVIQACRQTGGTGFSVHDKTVFECQDLLAKKEGIYCEPAGAVALAGVLKAVESGAIDKRQPVVCIVTGHGFKDPLSVQQIAAKAESSYIESVKELMDYLSMKIKS